MTGALCFRRRWFFQALEGEPETIQQFFEKISEDRRHQDAKIVSIEKSVDRWFSQWSMQYADDDAMLALKQTNGVDNSSDPKQLTAEGFRNMFKTAAAASQSGSLPGEEV